MAAVGICQAEAKDDVAGYTPEMQPQAAALPLYLIAQQETVRPQYAYLPLAPNSVIDAHTLGLGFGPTVVGGVVAGVLVNAMARAESIALARDNWQWLNNGQCRIDTRTHVEPALVQALATAGMPAASAHVLLEDDKLQEHYDPEKAHLRVSHSSSMTPDLVSLLTTVRVEGWADKGSGRHKPEWANVLQVLSTPMWLQDKQDHDSAYLKQQLDQWYAGTGNPARIAQVNAAGRNADPALRRQASGLQTTYSARLRRITRDGWNPYAMGMMRALSWGQEDCAPIERALQDNAAEVARLLGLLYAGQLPVTGQVLEAPASGQEARVMVTPSVALRYEQPRELVELAPSVHLSAQQGGVTSVMYHHTVVSAEDLAEPGS